MKEPGYRFDKEVAEFFNWHGVTENYRCEYNEEGGWCFCFATNHEGSVYFDPATGEAAKQPPYWARWVIPLPKALAMKPNPRRETT